MTVRQREVQLWRRLIDNPIELQVYRCKDFIDLKKAQAIYDYVIKEEDKKRFKGFIDVIRLQHHFIYKQNDLDCIPSYQGARQVGRRYCKPEKGTSATIQTISREVRNTLYGDNYIEIDIVNALPTILYHFFGHLGLPHLERYVNDRDNFINSIDGVPPDIVKKAVITSLGTGKTVSQDTAQYRDQLLGCNFLNRLRFDHQDILDCIKSTYPDFYNSYRRSKGNVNGIIFLFANDVETIIIDIIIKYFAEKNILSSPLVYDAIFIPRGTIDDLTGLLDHLTKLVEDKLGISVAFKATLDFIDIIDFESQGIDITTIDGGQFYDEWKLEFEKTHYIITNPLVYAWVSPDGESQYFQLSKFVNEVCAEENKDYVKDWIADASKRKYVREVFHPPPVVTSDSYKNLYVGLAVESIPEIDTEDVIPLTSRVRHQLYVLSGGSHDSYTYLVKYLALRVQKPGFLPKVSLAFRSIQGTGKDSFFAFIGDKILGSQYYVQAPQAADLFSDRHSKSIIHKLLVVVSEVSRNDLKSVMNQMKSYITAPQVSYRPLYCPPMKSDNFAAVVLFGQDQQFLQIDSDDRRFAVFSTLSQFANQDEHFRPLHKDYQDPRVARAFYQYLMSQDISDFNPVSERPMTQERRSMMQFSIKPFRLFLLKKIDEMYEQYNEDSSVFTTIKTFMINRRDLRDRFNDWVQESGLYSSREYNSTYKMFFSELNAIVTEMTVYDRESKTYNYPINVIKVRGIVMVKFAYESVKDKLQKDYPENIAYEVDTTWDDVSMY
jgi:hypothetical protein